MDDKLKEKAEKAITQARVKLILGKRPEHVFFATLALRLELEAVDWVPTAGVDGRRMVYNPQFIASLKPEEVLGVMIHEVMHCFPQETPILTNRGLVPISEVVVGDRVWSNNQFTSVVETMKRHYSGEILEVKPASGPAFKVTPEHPILVLRMRPRGIKSSWGVAKSVRNAKEKKMMYLPASELDPSRDLLVFRMPDDKFPSKIKSRPKRQKVGPSRNYYKKRILYFDEKIAYLSGFFVADGNLAKPYMKGGWFGKTASKRVIVWSLGLEDPQERLLDAIRSINRKPTVFKPKNVNVFRIIVSAKTLAKFLAENFYEGEDKTIPAWLLDQPKNIIRAFVDGLVDGDGHRSPNRNTSVSSVYRGVWGMLPLLLTKLGFQPGLGEAQVKSNGFPNARPSRNINWIEDRKLNRGARIGKMWYTKIMGLSKSKHDGLVYNMETGNHTYALPFVTVHNCSNGHMSRRGNRDPLKWNLAADMALNPIIKESGFTLPQGGLFPGQPPFAKLKPGESAESYYAQIPDPQVVKISVSGGQGQGGGKDGKGCQDPGGCGGVMDASQSQAENAAAEQEWKVAVAQAASLAKQRGTMPAGLSREVENLLNPVVDWKQVLREFVRSASRNDYSWSRPNRRFIHAGLYLPSLYSEELGDVVCFIDTSGSVGPDELRRFASELQGVLECYPCKLHIVYHDSEVAGVQVWEPADGPLRMQPKGGGGTDHRPAFKWVEKEGLDPACLIALSDMESCFPKHAPPYPVLWGVVGGQTKVPFGRHLKVDLR